MKERKINKNKLKCCQIRLLRNKIEFKDVSPQDWRKVHDVGLDLRNGAREEEHSGDIDDGDEIRVLRMGRGG